VRIRWIRENRSNLWKFRSRNESTIRIFKVRIRESGFANLWSQDSWHDTKRIFLESGFVTTIRNESMDSRNESTFLRISYTNPASLHFFLKFQHRVSLDYLSKRKDCLPWIRSEWWSGLLEAPKEEPENEILYFIFHLIKYLSGSKHKFRKLNNDNMFLLGQTTDNLCLNIKLTKNVLVQKLSR